jgi:hypothetical protein
MKGRGWMCALALCAAGCGGPTGAVSVTVWGEEFVSRGIPAETFADRWSVRFTRFLVHVSGVRLGATGGGTYALEGPGRVWSLVPATAPLPVGTLSGVEARRLDQVQFDLTGAGTDAIAGNASADDLATMRAGGLRLYVEGTATRADRGEYRFRWGFTGATRFSACQDDQGARGLVVSAGAAATEAQITIHADHLFYDGLSNMDAQVRFDAVAGADRNGDREVTLDELAAVSLASLPAGQYQTGSARGVETLRDFVSALVGTMAHWNGEGHCDASRPPGA